MSIKESFVSIKLRMFKMYFIRIESCVFSDLSHFTNTIPVLKSSFLSVLSLFCFVTGITAVLKAAERQIEVLEDVRSTQEK